MRPIIKKLFNNKGNGVVDVVIVAGIIVFLILPIISIVLEKNIALAKGQIIKDAVDVSNIATYNALNITQTSKVIIAPNNTDALEIYKQILATNLNLNDDLTPKPDSLADGPVTIDSFIIYTGGFPVTCPRGTILTRVSVHTEITVPIKPSLYRQVILDLMGKEFVDLKVHVDSDIPVNN